MATIHTRRPASSSPASSSSFLTLLLCLCLSCLLLLPTAQALPLEGRVSITPTEAPPPTKVVLSGGRYATLTAADGSFRFADVPAGTYLLEVLSPKNYFSQIKISIRPDAPDEAGKILCLEYKYPGAPKAKAFYPLHIKAHSEYTYFERRDAWATLRASLTSPMTLMLIVSVVAAIWLPKAMDGLSEDEKQALNEQMKSSGNPTDMLQNLLGGGGSAAAAAGGGGGAPGGGGGKRGGGGGGGGGGEGKKQN